MKKLISKLVLLCVVVVSLTGCTPQNTNRTDSKIKVIATLFPQYDFAKNIAGDKIDIKLLLPPGTESHTYEPTPSDILNIASARLFLYTGEYMEPWAEKIISGISSDDFKVIDVSNGISLMKEEHHHDDDDDDEHEEHNHEYDPHIWLDPTLAMKMVDNIKTALCEVDPENSSFYEQNSINYKNKLSALDESFKSVVETGKRNQVVFGGRFAHLYFIKRYNLEYQSAFDSCSTEMEPSVKKVTQIIDFIKENDIPCVYYEELSEPKIATFISEQTGAKALKFSTVHNLSKDQIENGTSYLDVMTENLENLKIGLN